jgi:hypothetical protein
LASTTWKEIAELLGIAAIVASLIFVGLQMKQSQEIAIAAQYHDRAALAVDAFNQQIDSGMLPLWGTFLDEKHYPTMSVEQRGHLYLWGTIYLTQADNHYFQYQSGFMEEEAWQAQYGTLKRVVRNPRSPVLPVLEKAQTQFRASFVVLINQIAKESDDQL